MELTLKQAKNELTKLENELDLYLTKKKINFEKTQPKASRIKDIVVSKSNTIFDSFSHYVIKDEECDDKIYSLQESIVAYQSYITKEINRMRKYDDIALIVYLKEEENWSWKDIDKELNCGADYARTKYKRFKKDGENKN